MLSIPPPSHHIPRNFPCARAYFQLRRSKFLCLNGFYENFKRPLHSYSPGSKGLKINCLHPVILLQWFSRAGVEISSSLNQSQQHNLQGSRQKENSRPRGWRVEINLQFLCTHFPSLSIKYFSNNCSSHTKKCSGSRIKDQGLAKGPHQIDHNIVMALPVHSRDLYNQTQPPQPQHWHPWSCYG